MAPDEARQQAIVAIQKLYNQAMAESTDRYWQNGPHNVKRWAARAFAAALEELKATPTEGESVTDYLRRIADKVRACRGLGPDEDDESWYDGAIDEAAVQISNQGLP